jgi:hypothetical protein
MFVEQTPDRKIQLHYAVLTLCGAQLVVNKSRICD